MTPWKLVAEKIRFFSWQEPPPSSIDLTVGWRRRGDPRRFPLRRPGCQRRGFLCPLSCENGLARRARGSLSASGLESSNLAVAGAAVLLILLTVAAVRIAGKQSVYGSWLALVPHHDVPRNRLSRSENRQWPTGTTYANPHRLLIMLAWGIPALPDGKAGVAKEAP